MRSKSFTSSAAPYASGKTDSGRVLTFYAATFSTTPDAVGDVVDPGAFDAWLAVFRMTPGKKLPIVMSHRWAEVPESVIGFAAADDITVDTHGLLIAAHLYDDSETASRTWQLAKDGVLTDASFSYTVLDERRDASGINHLRMFGDVLEAGPCLVGVNREANIVGAKTARNLHDGQFAAREQLNQHLQAAHGLHLVDEESLPLTDLEEVHRLVHEKARALQGAAREEIGELVGFLSEEAAFEKRRTRTLQEIARLELSLL